MGLRFTVLYIFIIWKAERLAEACSVAQVQSMGKHLAQQIQSWKMPRVLRVEEVVGAIMELLADDGEGGGAVLAVTAQAGRTYWRRQKSGRQQKSGAPRRPPPRFAPPHDNESVSFWRELTPPLPFISKL